ncbi:hypothetical protein QVD17_19092 [Tagetes erecta]|uniref:Uncharacterized protein n=1 Tax=Tagetes erecta TaxID=13708 RepID=A0AAD8NWZ8_TARER|nr:hypothetical protein QVD17_19092 [Tagetes erecta]
MNKHLVFRVKATTGRMLQYSKVLELYLLLRFIKKKSIRALLRVDLDQLLLRSSKVCRGLTSSPSTTTDCPPPPNTTVQASTTTTPTIPHYLSSPTANIHHPHCPPPPTSVHRPPPPTRDERLLYLQILLFDADKFSKTPREIDVVVVRFGTIVAVVNSGYKWRVRGDSALVHYRPRRDDGSCVVEGGGRRRWWWLIGSPGYLDLDKTKVHGGGWGIILCINAFGPCGYRIDEN